MTNRVKNGIIFLCRALYFVVAVLIVMDYDMFYSQRPRVP
jgi:hypothetical protein